MFHLRRYIGNMILHLGLSLYHLAMLELWRPIYRTSDMLYVQIRLKI